MQNASSSPKSVFGAVHHERGFIASVLKPLQQRGILSLSCRGIFFKHHCRPLYRDRFAILHSSSNLPHHHLLPAVVLHHQNLHHPHEDVDEVELKRNALVNGILADDAALRQAGVVQDLLDVVQGEAAEDGKTAVERDALGDGERADGSGGQDHGREAGGDDDAEAGQERSADVEVLVLLSGGADDGEGSHHGDGVEAGAGEEGTGDHRQERGDHGGLGRVEGRPHGVLGDVAAYRQLLLC